jgi:RNA polymerase sigma factor (TIGR02999 family)
VGKVVPHENLTGLLRAWARGDAAAGERLIPLVYDELRRQAARYLRRERPGHTLRPTALVHEAYLRLAEQREDWENRAHFFAVASTLMRRILVDHARRRRAAKRAGQACRVTLTEDVAVEQPRDVDLLALEAALDELAAFDATKARLVELRFFGGLTIEETSSVLDLSVATLVREWRLAKAWLYRRLHVDGARPQA